MNISIGNDHAGTQYKKTLCHWLKNQGHSVLNHGTDTEESVDYPDFVHPVAQDVEAGKADFGIVICGSGNGAAITANKHPQIRAALCWNTELAALARQHNNANVLSLPARFISENEVLAMVKTFLSTSFEGGRHQNRIDKMTC